jgi:hypothetical protein
MADSDIPIGTPILVWNQLIGVLVDRATINSFYIYQVRFGCDELVWVTIDAIQNFGGSKVATLKERIL